MPAVAPINLPLERGAPDPSRLVRRVQLPRSKRRDRLIRIHPLRSRLRVSPGGGGSADTRHDALTRWIERWLEAWEDAWDEVDEFAAVGDRVVAAVRVHGRGRSSGLEISQRLFDVHELRDGRVLRITEYLDRGEAIEAAGLPSREGLAA